MQRTRVFGLMLLGLALAAVPALAFVPQTINVDGVNDFHPSNLLDADGLDTQSFCAAPDTLPLDQGSTYLTNDNSKLYFGFDYNRSCFDGMNLGIAIDVRKTVAGGTADAFGRQIAWNNVPYAPDFYVYDVVPGANTFNYEVLYEWTGTAWSVVKDGSNGLGIIDNTGFQEGELLLSDLGASIGDTLNIEFWVTQDESGTPKKGPLDALCSDAAQLSTPTSTQFDTLGAAVEMTCMFEYVLQGIDDMLPPEVVSATAVGFSTDPTGQIETLTNLVDIKFTEPVAFADVPANYSISAAGVNVSGAVVDGSDPTLYHLTLDNPISPAASFFDVLVSNVFDQASVPNAMVEDGTKNRGSFFVKKLVFEGDFSIILCRGTSPADSFSIEGSLSPLTFIPLDNALMTDADVDSIYTTTVPMSVVQDKGTGIAEATLAWKFYNKGLGYEPRSDRTHVVSSTGGDCDTLAFFWDDLEATEIISHPIDVCFQVDASPFSPGPLDTITVVGDQAPLPDFTAEGIQLKDDGIAPDVTVGDGIYAGYVRFPECTFASVKFKFKFNGAFECSTQGDRDVFLNDAVFDTVGGANGPLPLPARKIDRCTVTDKEVAVHFRLNTEILKRLAVIDSVFLATDEVGALGEGGSFGLVDLIPIFDAGTGIDVAAGDDTFSVSIVFPDSTEQTVEYKYLAAQDGVLLTPANFVDYFECPGFGNRTVFLDDVNFGGVFNPIIPRVAQWNYCTDLTSVGIPDDPGSFRPAVTLYLAQNYPNPFRGARATTIEFRLENEGPVRVEIFDVAGRRVKSLLDREVTSGLHLVQWNGLNDSGAELAPGIYFYSVTSGEKRESKRMVLMP